MSYGTNQNLLYYLFKIQMPRKKDKPTLSLDPLNKPVVIVMPDLETPGIKANA